MTNLDVRLSLRVLRRHAKLSLIAVLSLAIGLAAAFIGLCTYRAVPMRPPAVSDPDQLLTVYTVTPDQPFNELSYPDYVELRDRNHVFSGLAAIPFSMRLGRGFATGDDTQVTQSAVLSHAYEPGPEPAEKVEFATPLTTVSGST